MSIIPIASDHAGLPLKQQLITTLTQEGLEFEDLGTDTAESVDYPDYANMLCRRLLGGELNFGILVCGTGIGMAIAANRHRGIRAAVLHNATEARLTRAHNNANVACLGARIIGIETALDAVATFLNTEFEGGRHQRRIDKIGV